MSTSQPFPLVFRTLPKVFRYNVYLWSAVEGGSLESLVLEEC